MVRLYAVVVICAVATSVARAEYDAAGDEPAQAQVNTGAPRRSRVPNPGDLARLLSNQRQANWIANAYRGCPPIYGPVPIELDPGLPLIKGPADPQEVFKFWIEFFRSP
jgi:hypothetical protein